VQDKPHIALLPGLDGTGELFSPIIPFLEKHFEVHVVKYSDELSFDDYVESAASQLPARPVSLVAESFSGPIAIELLANRNLKFEASVLSATFCKSPRPLITRAAKYLPQKFFTSHPLSRLFLDWFVTGRAADAAVRSNAQRLLDQVSPAVFQKRIDLLNEIDVTPYLKTIEVPLLYIQATRDKIVLQNSGNEIVKNARRLKLMRVDGSHMILQTRPEKCAELIVEHVTSKG
jgi:pimeloyl-ACP methyl ester carboxylesterase